MPLTKNNHTEEISTDIKKESDFKNDKKNDFGNYAELSGDSFTDNTIDKLFKECNFEDIREKLIDYSCLTEIYLTYFDISRITEKTIDRVRDSIPPEYPNEMILGGENGCLIKNSDNIYYIPFFNAVKYDDMTDIDFQIQPYTDDFKKIIKNNDVDIGDNNIYIYNAVNYNSNHWIARLIESNKDGKGVNIYNADSFGKNGNGLQRDKYSCGVHAITFLNDLLFYNTSEKSKNRFDNHYASIGDKKEKFAQLRDKIKKNKKNIFPEFYEVSTSGSEKNAQENENKEKITLDSSYWVDKELMKDSQEIDTEKTKSNPFISSNLSLCGKDKNPLLTNELKDKEKEEIEYKI